MVVGGQGQYVYPPSDNYNLPLDPNIATRYIDFNCSYKQDGATISYVWTKDGALFDAGATPGVTSVPAPDGDYNSTIEGTYSCTATVNRVPIAESRNIIIRLPGK